MYMYTYIYMYMYLSKGKPVPCGDVFMYYTLLMHEASCESCGILQLLVSHITGWCAPLCINKPSQDDCTELILVQTEHASQ